MQSVGVPLQVFVLFNNLISSSSLYFFFFVLMGLKVIIVGITVCTWLFIYLHSLILPIVCTIFFGSLFLYNITVASFDRNYFFFLL